MAADNASPGPAAPSLDGAALRAWLDGAEYDAQERRLRPPAGEFSGAREVSRILGALSPTLGDERGVITALTRMLRFLIAAAERKDHPLAQKFAPLLDYYERVSRDFVTGGIAALASGAFELEPPAEGPTFVRGCYAELLSHTCSLLAEHGFFDTAPGGKKGVIVVNGRYRTGSTLVLNAANEILKVKGQSTRVRGAEFESVDRMIDCFDAGAYRGHWLLIKAHNWLPREARDGVLVLYTMRNLADVAASVVRLWQRRASPEKRADEQRVRSGEYSIVVELRTQKLLNDFATVGRPMLRIDYDTWCHDKTLLIEHLAGAMNMTLTAAEARQAAHEIDTAHVKEMTDAMTAECDDGTQLRRLHVSETLGAKHGGLDALSPRLRDALKELGEWPSGRDG